ncbi:hypothetical protein SAMN06265222_101968 [Neorhodopirellula lusitana]|uniref:Uncharacterized protein n=1 Tax=Neorhodopirellula lusitana TaxID=445327 RepID=A0ABY1PT81_9BACT|nr:hypothetical protein SAMN06265222_101968 [Neorhodopirellula lusitana]
MAWNASQNRLELSNFGEELCSFGLGRNRKTMALNCSNQNLDTRVVNTKATQSRRAIHTRPKERSSYHPDSLRAGGIR